MRFQTSVHFQTRLHFQTHTHGFSLGAFPNTAFLRDAYFPPECSFRSSCSVTLRCIFRHGCVFKHRCILRHGCVFRHTHGFSFGRISSIGAFSGSTTTCRSLAFGFLLIGVSSKIVGQTLHGSFATVLFSGGKSSISYISKTWWSRC